MKYMLYGAMAFCAFMCAGLSAADTVVDSTTKESFPSQVTIDHDGKQYQLEATGVATRKKLIVKVYSIASYLQKGAAKPGADNLAAILSDENAKQLTLKWVRAVGGAQVQETYQESLHKAFSDQQYAQLKSVIDTFLSFFSAGAAQGDVFVLQWLPGGYVEVLINNKKVGSVTNAAFAKGLWTVWFGEKSVVNSKELLSLIK